MSADSHTTFLHRYHLKEIKDHVKTGGNHIVGPFGTCTLVLHDPDQEDTKEFEVQLTFALTPGSFKPLAFYCEHEGRRLSWQADPMDPFAPDPPTYCKAFVKRVAEELAVRSLGSSYTQAKEAADGAYEVMVRQGFMDV